VSAPSPDAAEQDDRAAIDPDDILVVRRGPGANCSSIGSALDVLFVTAAVAGAILVGVAAALGEKAPRAAPPREDRGEEGEDRGAGEG
jgi:hypothetical protein